MARTVIRRLVARDEAGREVVLEPGTSIDSYTIHRDVAGGDVYSMGFRSEGRGLRCGLVEFQARTEGRPSPASPGWSYAGTNAGMAS